MNKQPLISCICVTKDRSDYLRRAVLCFISQDYQNKELVISIPEDDDLSKIVVDDIQENNLIKIKVIKRSKEMSLGNARNQAISRCSGEYICIWDDDDWYHTSRLNYQFNCLKTVNFRFQACVLSRIILYDLISKTAYYSFSYTWDGTLFCKKEILLQNQYANSNFGEDTHVISFLSGKNQLLLTEKAPYLYIYVYHGENTWDYNHFKYFLQKSEKFDETTNNSVRMLVSPINYYDHKCLSDQP